MTVGNSPRMAILAALLAVPAIAEARSKEILSKTYTIDAKYRSMNGPTSTQQVVLSPGERPELYWITGYRATVVGADDRAPRSQEFMCHSNLDLPIKDHAERFGWTKAASDRLFTLSQGQQEIEFPKGFGIPVLSNEVFALTTQVLNFNFEGKPFDVRHKVEIRYARDRDLTAEMVPLFMKAATGLKVLEGTDGYYGISHPDAEQHGESCLVGQPASGDRIEDQFGRKFTGHWKVAPGREVNHTPVTQYLRLPYDTNIHYITVHLHPFAESLELRDLTTKQTVFKSQARGFSDKVGLERVEHYSSPEGIPVYESHEYELVSVYDNTSGSEQDSMAVMFLYLAERDFRKPKLAAVPQPISPTPSGAPRR